MSSRRQYLHRKSVAFAAAATLATLAPAFAGSPVPVDSTWQTNVTGNWSNSGNWSNGLPDAPGSTARFTGNTLAAVNVDGTRTLGRILITGNTNYTISGSALTLNNTGGVGTDTLVQSDTGTQVISAPLTLSLFTNFDIAANSGSLSLNGAITGVSSSVDIFGPGTILFGSSNGYSGTTMMSNATLGGGGSISGFLIVSLDATLAPSATLSASNTATFTVGSLLTNTPSSTLAFHLVTPGASSVNDKIVVTAAGGLTFNGGAIAVTANSTGAASLGYYKAIQYTGAIGGTGISSLTLPAQVGNVVYILDTAHDAGFIDIHRGFLGDANDDGTVNFADFVLLSNHYGLANQGWTGADFNNDHTTNFADFVILSNHYGQSIAANALTATPNELAALQAFATAHAIPEPAAITLLTLASLPLLTRRGKSLPRSEAPHPTPAPLPLF